jgi:hypothetical protein
VHRQGAFQLVRGLLQGRRNGHEMRAELRKGMKIRIVVRCAPVKSNDVLGRLWKLSRQAQCRLLGHRDAIELGSGKLALKCGRCGRKSPGWTIDERRPSSLNPARRGT